jgi:NAD(P)-dependent dehydrogenase (short-subunit alcohol dehydrogenase family)
MTETRTLLVVGGTAGMGRRIVERYAGEGWRVVLTGRDPDQAKAVAAEIGGDTAGVGLDLSRPVDVEAALAGVGPVDHIVLAAIARDTNTVRDYNVASATYLVTMKLVGFTAVVHAMLDRIAADGSVVMFGGRAKDRPYPGSTTVSTVNAGVSGLMHSLALQVAPVRVNTLHPGIVADSPYWSENRDFTERVRSATPTGRNVAMVDIVDAVDFLLRNRSVNGIDLYVDGGWLLP